MGQIVKMNSDSLKLACDLDKVTDVLVDFEDLKDVCKYSESGCKCGHEDNYGDCSVDNCPFL